MRKVTSIITEAEIVKALYERRREGQVAAVSRYADRIFAMIVRQVPDVLDAQELTQDTFLRAFSRIDSYDANKASLATWLCRIAYRLTLDFLKRRRPQIVSIEDSQVWQTDISEEELEAELSTGREERITKLEKLLRSEDRQHLGNEKNVIYFALLSVCTTLLLCSEDRRHLGNEKKRDLFCIALGLHDFAAMQRR